MGQALERLAAIEREVWSDNGGRHTMARRDLLAHDVLQAGLSAEAVAHRLGVRASDVVRWANTAEQLNG